MATSTLEYTAASQERVLDAVRQSQSAVLDIMSTWTKAVEKATPDMPAVPVLAGLPSAQELLTNGYDFAGKLLDAQREFSLNLLAAAPTVKTTPVEAPVAAKK